MFAKRSGRLNPSFNHSQNYNPVYQEQANPPHFAGYSSQQRHKQFQFQKELEEQELQQQRYFSHPQIHELNEEKDFIGLEKNLKDSKEGIEQNQSFDVSQNASATTKALAQLEVDGMDKKKWKKNGRIPVAAKRKKLNQRLSKLLTPKSALILLHELKPGCVYKVQEQAGCIPPSFFAQVDLNGQILGAGQGLSKSQAKNSAAENAIKTIVSRTMTRCADNREEGDAVGETEKEDTPENLPWAGLASYAIYKMFNEWQNQGADVLPISRPAIKKKSPVANAPTKKVLPPNATELHPAVVLNMVSPGLTAVELEREDTPKCRVKMAYVIDGKIYSGVGGNKKDAKKEAAKAVLEELYGLSYR